MKKKLLHLQLLPLLSGVQNFSLHLLDGLSRDEFDIWIACKPGGEFVPALKARGYSYIPLPSFVLPISPLDLITFLHLLLIFRREKFDIVHTHASKPGLLGRIAAKLCGVPLVLHTFHVTAFQDYQSWPVHRFFRAMDWLGNRFCDLGIFVNNSAREQCIEYGVISPITSCSIYNAIADAMRCQLEPLAQNRKPAKGMITIGSTFRFTTQKNVLQILRCACQLCKEQKQLRFIFVGDGEDYPACRQMVQESGMGERILLPGWDTGIAAYLKIFDLFIMFSNWEAQPFSVIEAMYAGCRYWYPIFLPSRSLWMRRADISSPRPMPPCFESR
jgi:glycosyltransferase involved in cell wall biosynthesis